VDRSLDYHLQRYLSGRSPPRLPTSDISYSHPLFFGYKHLIINPKLYWDAGNISWQKAGEMCQQKSAYMTTSHTVEKIEEIQSLIQFSPTFYIHPAMVYLNVRRKKKVRLL